MGDPTSELTDGLHSLCLPKLCFERLLVGYVTRVDDDRFDASDIL